VNRANYKSGEDNEPAYWDVFSVVHAWLFVMVLPSAFTNPHSRNSAAAHRHGAYDYLMNDHDRAMFEWVKKFNPYDLYSKGRPKPDLAELKPYYDDLFAEFFPARIAW